MVKKLPPRISISGETPDYARPVNSLNELSKKLGVSVYKLRQWKNNCEELKSGRPYAVGRCMLQLIALGKISKDSILELDKELQLALVLDVAVDAFEHQRVTEVADAMLEDESLVELLSKEDDPSRLRDGLRMSGPFRPKSWNGLERDESATIAIASPKTAALFYDRVWCMDNSAPRDIGLRFNTFEERTCLGLIESLFFSVSNALGADEEKIQAAEKKLQELDVETKCKRTAGTG